MIELIKNNKVVTTFLVVSFLLKLAFMPISVHSDIFAIESFPPLLLKEHVIDIFSYMDKKNLSYFYPPLTYYSFAFFEFVIHFFSDTFLAWMNGLRIADLNGLKGQAVDYIRAVPNPNMLKDLFLAKTPFLLFDIASIIVLLKFAKAKMIKSKSIILWVVNPVIIYTTYLFGQFDIIVLFFILLGFFLIRRNTKLGMLSLGIAAAFKSYPFIIVLPTAIIFGANFKQRLKLIAVAALPFIISILPVLINNPQLLIFTFFPKNLFHYKGALEGWQKYSQLVKYGLLSLSYVLILVLSAFLKLKDKLKTSTGISLVVVLLALTLAGRTHFHYLIWEMPLLILWFRNNLKFLTIVILIQTISFASYKILASQLQLGLFAPLNPDYFGSLPTFNSQVNQIIPYRFISTLGFIVFTFVNIYLILKILTFLLFRAEVKKR